LQQKYDLTKKQGTLISQIFIILAAAVGAACELYNYLCFFCNSPQLHYANYTKKLDGLRPSSFFV